ncbi:MAG TPA: tRNA (5-methylaminomethyl-2-thiouridine)(34)-methyltransferase MnmD [Saprospiraceae bacterium]|nr:tRNA (5-methylaminomethyl-2-thiouridine)(34)-methyltransferase MnmD [Saprospiraceae bacterium]
MTDTVHSTRLGLNEVYIVPTRDGSNTLFSQRFNSTYHSIHGAVSESRHVFIQNGLYTQSGKAKLNILEIGFGTGLNAFLAYLFSIRNNILLSYIGIDAFPISPEVAAKLDYPGYLAANDLADVFLKMHDSDKFKRKDFNFQLLNSLEQTPKKISFDCIFFDAFHPEPQPELWSQDIFAMLYKITATHGCLVTYCAQGEVRRSMEKAGFKVERIPGATGKREMLRAVKAV